MGGAYVLRYDCQDSAGNVAQPLFRTVHIEDKSCPEVTMLGSQVNYVEAGYAWVDPGATCKDDLDDACTVRVEGDVVNTGGAFYERSSCKDILLNYCHEQHFAKNEQLTFTHNPMEDARATVTTTSPATVPAKRSTAISWVKRLSRRRLAPTASAMARAARSGASRST